MTRERALEEMGPAAWKSALPVELHASTWIGDQAIDFVRTHAGEAPFFLGPASPTRTRRSARPRRTPTATTPDDMPRPLRRPGELADKPAHFRGEADAYEPGWRPFGRGHVAHEPRDDRADAQARAAYYAMIELVDHNVGRILARPGSDRASWTAPSCW